MLQGRQSARRFTLRYESCDPRPGGKPLYRLRTVMEPVDHVVGDSAGEFGLLFLRLPRPELDNDVGHTFRGLTTLRATDPTSPTGDAPSYSGR